MHSSCALWKTRDWRLQPTGLDTIIAAKAMLTSLQIENFKCFRQLKIEPLAKVNLIVGTSNSGKTALLEAIDWLPFTRTGLNAAGFRDPTFSGQGHENARWLFWNLDEETNHIHIRASRVNPHYPNIDTFISSAPQTFVIPGAASSNVHTNQPIGGNAFVGYGPSQNPLNISTVNTTRVYATELARQFDQWTLRSDNEDRFIQFLRSVEPRLRTLRPMEHTGTRLLYADIKLSERIPLPLLGEGFNRLIQIVGAIIGEGADILLIDEIENGLHWSALPQIWTGIREAVSKEEVQIFATTHSRECIEAAAEVFKGEPKNDLAVHRLERHDDGEIHCVTMGEDELERMLDRGWEVR